MNTPRDLSGDDRWYYRIGKIVQAARWHDFWCQVAIVALLSGYDRIGEKLYSDGACSTAETLAEAVVQEYINPEIKQAWRQER